MRGGDAYRGAGPLPSNDFVGFPCGHALATANDRLGKLRARLREASDLDVQLHAVPFLRIVTARGRKREEAVEPRREP